MSEYQYYEFQAIDRPLTPREMAELRKYSTRATINCTRFVNSYEWGDFKGDASAWMERYFDAFVYVANWGTRELMLRFPRGVLHLETAKQYCRDEAARPRPRQRRHPRVPLRQRGRRGLGRRERMAFLPCSAAREPRKR